jgi:hypothetical protein
MDLSLKPTTSIQLVLSDAGDMEGMRDHLRRTTRFRVEIAGYHHILTF